MPRKQTDKARALRRPAQALQCLAASAHELTRPRRPSQSYQRAEREAAALARKQASYGLLLPDEEARALAAPPQL